MNKQHEIKSEVLKALGHPIRLCIVEGLMGVEKNVASMVDCLVVPQPTVSQHLNILKGAGIITGKRAGNQMLYKVCSDEAKKIINALK